MPSIHLIHVLLLTCLPLIHCAAAPPSLQCAYVTPLKSNSIVTSFCNTYISIPTVVTTLVVTISTPAVSTSTIGLDYVAKRGLDENADRLGPSPPEPSSMPEIDYEQEMKRNNHQIPSALAAFGESLVSSVCSCLSLSTTTTTTSTTDITYYTSTATVINNPSPCATPYLVAGYSGNAGIFSNPNAVTTTEMLNIDTAQSCCELCYSTTGCLFAGFDQSGAAGCFINVDSSSLEGPVTSMCPLGVKDITYSSAANAGLQPDGSFLFDQYPGPCSY